MGKPPNLQNLQFTYYFAWYRGLNSYPGDSLLIILNYSYSTPQSPILIMKALIVNPGRIWHRRWERRACCDACVGCELQPLRLGFLYP